MDRTSADIKSAGRLQSEAVQEKRGPVASVEPVENHGARPSLMSRLWLFECFAWILCATGLAAIAIILAVTQDKPVPNWTIQSSYVKTKFTVTINSVIALFSTLIKSTLLVPVVASLHQLKWLHFRQEHPLADFKKFDSAGKGPLGSAILIWSLRGRRLACLGAFLTLAALGLDFTLQQLVTYPLRPSPVGDASIPRTNLYSNTRVDNTNHFGIPPDTSMFAAAYYGLYNYGGDKFLTTPQCLTGNCSWTAGYASLGVCSRCSDVSYLINTTCSTWNYVSQNTDENGNVINQTTIGAPIAYCNYSLPNGQTIVGRSQFQITGDEPITLLANGTSAGGDSYFSNGMYSHISSFTIMRGTWARAPPEDETRLYSNLTSANATECGLDICVHHYNGTVETNVFTETLLGTFLNESDIGQVSDLNRSLYITPPEEWTAAMRGQHEGEYSVSRESMFALNGLFQGQGNSGPLWQGSVFQDTNYVVPPAPSNELTAYLNLLNGTQIAGMVASVAASMTKQMRQAPGIGISASEATALGTVYKDLPYVNVRWGWIAYPVVLIFLALLFLIMTAIKDSRDKDTMLWKSDILATFFHPLTKDGREVLAHVNTPEEADEIAEKIQVRCEKTDLGYRLVNPRD